MSGKLAKARADATTKPNHPSRAAMFCRQLIFYLKAGVGSSFSTPKWILCMPSDREALRLRDIVENIDRISDHIGVLEADAFVEDAKTLDAVERCLQRITEAVVKIGPERMMDIAPELPVQEVRAFGNLLRHGYDEINPYRVFDTVSRMLPGLRQRCVSALTLLKDSS